MREDMNESIYSRIAYYMFVDIMHVMCFSVWTAYKFNGVEATRSGDPATLTQALAAYLHVQVNELAEKRQDEQQEVF